MQGDELYHELARTVLPLLVRQAKAGEPITYGSLAEELGMLNARNLNRPLGSIGTSLEQLRKKWKQRIPLIQTLVVNKNTRLPGQGIGVFLPPGPKTDFAGWVKDEQAKVYAYRRWDDVLRALKPEPATSNAKSLVGAARVTNKEIFSHLATVSYDRDRRRRPDPYRHDQFVVGWKDAAVRQRKGYTKRTLRSLTWRNLGFRFGQHFGSRTKKKIEQVWNVLASHYERARGTEAAGLVEEIDPPPLVEGAVKNVAVNAYERNSTARAQCLDAHGVVCAVCGFNFGKQYGLVAEGYIHVHHLRPLSEIKASYMVDPKKDLRPVCPNCHAVIRRNKPPFTLKEVRAMLAAGDDRDTGVD